MSEGSYYDKNAADYAVGFIECLCHTKGTWARKPFELIDWQEQIIRDIFGTLKPNGYRQFNTAYIEIPKKQGKSELAAAVALLLTCGDGEERAEVYGCAADRQQASIVFNGRSRPSGALRTPRSGTSYRGTLRGSRSNPCAHYNPTSNTFLRGNCGSYPRPRKRSGCALAYRDKVHKKFR